MRGFTLRDLGFVAAGQAGATLWTPAQITTALWLDAADAATITTVSGAVSQWNDKSGNGRNATQTTSTARPTKQTAIQNGLDLLRFDGSDDFMEFDSSFLAGTRTFEIFCLFVYRGTGSGNYQPTMGSASTSDAEDVGAWHYLKSDGTAASYPNYNLWGNYDGLGSYAVNSFSLIEFLAEGATWRVMKNTLQEGTGITSGFNVKSQNTRCFIAGQGAQPGRRSRNDYAEIVITSGLSTANRERMRGYILHKWDLAANLPVGHLYKSAAPTV